MIKKRITKLLMILLCAVLVMPLSLSLSNAKAASDEVSAYYGVDFTYTTSNQHIVAKGNKVILTATVDGGTAVELFKDGSIKTDSTNTYVLTSYASGKVTARITKPGNYTFKIESIKESETETLFTDTQKVKVYGDINATEGGVEVFKGPSYEFDDAKRTEYQSQVVYGTYADPNANEKISIYVGDSYTVPSIEKLVNTGAFAYSQYRRIINYLAPTSTSYNQTTATGTNDATFTISKVGTFRFYITFSFDEIDGKNFGLGVDNLEEFSDGWYSMVKDDNSNQKLYVTTSGTSVKYYEDEDYEVEYKGAVKKDKLIVPIFEFEITNSGPKVKFNSTYQENGYIGLQYTSISATVSGNDLTTTYTLMYKSSLNDNWAEATESFDSSSKKFVPEKVGYYMVVVKAIDGEGKTATAESAIVTVLEKYENVEYKTSFKDWIKVNYLPFIFLCISGACLIAIILLLVIKPKDSKKTFKEEDK